MNDQPINDEPLLRWDEPSGLGRYDGKEILQEFIELKWVSIQRGEREYPL